MIPDPSLPGNINNAFRLNGCCPILSRNAYTGKIDHVLTSRQKLWGSFTWNKRDRYNRNNSRTFLPFPGQPINPVKRQIVGGPQVRIAHSWTISSRSVNEFSVGYNRFQNKNNITDNAKFTPKLGIPGIPNDCFPPMRFGGHNLVTPLFGVGCKNVDPSESYVYQDTFSYLRGKHSMKFGGEFRRYRYNTYEPRVRIRPNRAKSWRRQHSRSLGVPGRLPDLHSPQFFPRLVFQRSRTTFWPSLPDQ